MKNRWIGGLALATALTLGACAPEQQGADEPDAADQTTETASPEADDQAEATESSEPSEEAEESESAEPTPDDYEY